MEKIPDEILEFILGFLPPYGDLQKCLLVSKRWHQCAKNVISKTSVDLYRAIIDFNVVWETIAPLDLTNTIAKRYSHSAVVYKDSMYVFGGCTCSSTTFNDLWRLNLSTRKFDRLLTMGTYPSPKACASIVCYKDTLILFGGWTHPSPYPLHQTWKLFDELHIYDIAQNRWSKHTNLEENPPPMAGHSVTVHKDLMIVFGGLQKHQSSYMSQFSSSNDIWCFSLTTRTWFKQATSKDKPKPRYGQSQIYLDAENLLIIGGCGGSNLIYSDCWLLTIDSTDAWKWRRVKIMNKEGGSGNMWCNQACKVGDKLVVLSQAKATTNPMYLSNKWNLPNQIKRASNRNRVAPNSSPDDDNKITKDPLMKMYQPRETNVNGKWGSLARKPSNNEPENNEPGPSDYHDHMNPVNAKLIKGNNAPCCMNRSVSLGNSPKQLPKYHATLSNPSVHHSMDYNLSPEMRYSVGLSAKGMLAFQNKLSPATAHSERLRRLDVMTQRLREQENIMIENDAAEVCHQLLTMGDDSESIPSPKKHRLNRLAIYVLDISQVKIDDPYATWLTNEKSIFSSDAPEETILYSFVAGKGELIMFGGIKRDANCLTDFSNSTEQVSNTAHFISAPKCVI